MASIQHAAQGQTFHSLHSTCTNTSSCLLFHLCRVRWSL